MKKILILVEGQTEEAFVNSILRPFFEKELIYVVPKIICTKVINTGKNRKGGIGNYDHLRGDIDKLLMDTSANIVTTMIDLYGLPDDFPVKDVSLDCYKKVINLELGWAKNVNNSRFIPYLQLHEFEALLFSDPGEISLYHSEKTKTKTLEEIVKSCGSPEKINNGDKTHPSLRILNIFPSYKKVVAGSVISSRIGIERMRQECPHFNEWINRLLRC